MRTRSTTPRCLRHSCRGACTTYTRCLFYLVLFTVGPSLRHATRRCLIMPTDDPRYAFVGDGAPERVARGGTEGSHLARRECLLKTSADGTGHNGLGRSRGPKPGDASVRTLSRAAWTDTGV